MAFKFGRHSGGSGSRHRFVFGKQPDALVFTENVIGADDATLV